MKARIFAIAALAPLACLAACGEKKAPVSNEVTISDAVVRLPAVEGQPAAAYFTLQGGKAADRLEAVSSDKAASIEMHEGQMMNGMITMQPLSGVDVPARNTVMFKEGGNHAMIFGLDPSVKPETGLKLHFAFQSGKTIDVQATTIATGDEMPETESHEGH